MPQGLYNTWKHFTYNSLELHPCTGARVLVTDRQRRKVDCSVWHKLAVCRKLLRCLPQVDDVRLALSATKQRAVCHKFPIVGTC